MAKAAGSHQCFVKNDVSSWDKDELIWQVLKLIFLQSRFWKKEEESKKEGLLYRLETNRQAVLFLCDGYDEIAYPHEIHVFIANYFSQHVNLDSMFRRQLVDILQKSTMADVIRAAIGRNFAMRSDLSEAERTILINILQDKSLKKSIYESIYKGLIERNDLRAEEIAILIDS